MMKSIKYIIIVIATFLTVLSTRAQEVSVNVNPMRQILPPHVAYYLSNPGQYFSISVQNNTQEQQNIYFGVRLTQLSGSDNLEIYVPGTPYIPKAPMVLNPGQMKALNAVEMRTLFNHVPFNTISMPQSLFDNALSSSFGLLPEGMYELTLHVYRWDPSNQSPQIINNPTLSKCTFQVCYNASAPMWVNPFTHSGMDANYGALVYTVSAQSPMFQWMAPVVNCNPQARSYTYDFKVIEAPVGMDPNYLMEYGPTFYEVKGLTSPQCVLPINVTKYFCEGTTYAAQVTVHSNATQEGSLDFIKLENGGKSEIRLFKMTDFYEGAVIKTHYTAPTIVKPESTDALNKLSMISPLDPTVRWKAPVRSGDVSKSVSFKYNVRIVDFLSNYDMTEEGMRAALAEGEAIVGAYALTGSEFRIPDEDLKKFETGKAYLLEVVGCPDTAAYAWKRFEFEDEGHSKPILFTVSKSIVRPPQFTTPKPVTEIDGEIGDKVETLYMESPTISWLPYAVDEGRLPEGVRVTYNVKIVAPTAEYPHTLEGMQDALDELEPVHHWGNMSNTSCDVPARLFKEGDYNQVYIMQVEMKLVGPQDELEKVLLSNGGKSKPALVRLSTGARPTTYSAPVFLEPKPQTELLRARAELVELQYPMIRWEAPSMTGETDKAVEFSYDLKLVQPNEDYDNTIEDVQRAVEELPAVYERKGLTGTRFVLPHEVADEIDTTRIYVMRVYARPDTTVVGKNYVYDNNGRSVPSVVAFTNSGSTGRIEYSDTLNNFENPRLVEPAFLDDEGCRKKFINSDIAVSWRRPAYFGGFGAIDADSVKFTYDVEFYAADGYCSRSEMLEKEPVHKLGNITELNDTIHWDDIKDKVVTNSYCMIRVVPHATNDTTTVFKNDSINVVTFALADLISRDYYNCQSRVKFTNKQLTTRKAADLKGTTVKIGEYDLVLDGELEDKAPGVFKGKGHVPWSPIGVDWKLEVQFDSLVVNTDNRVIAGLVETWGGPNNKMTSTEIVDNLFSDWGIDNLIGDANIPYAEQLQGEADKRVKGLAETLHIAEYYNEVSRSLAKAENFLTGGSIGFPLQIPEKYNPSPVNLQITKMKFTPEYATMDLIGTFVIGDTKVTENEILVFGAPRLCISPESLIPEGGTVALLKDFTVKDPKSDFDFTFKAPSDIVEPQDGCFVIWSGGEFAALSADFEMTLPNLKKVVEGKVSEENPKLRLQAKIKNWDDWTAKGHLDTFEAEGAPGFTFGDTDVIIDYSKTENHPSCGSSVFPEDYKWTEIGLEGNTINAWMGMYIPSIEMSLPESMSINGKDRIKMSITDMIVDKSGITMNAGFEDLINYRAGDNGTIGGFAFSMDHIYVKVQQNDFRKFAFDGKLEIPLFKGEILYDCNIAPLSVLDNDKKKKGFAYVLRTRQIEDLNFDFMLGELKLENALTYFLVEAYDKYNGDIKDETVTNVELCVGGTVDIVGADKINSVLKKLPFDLHMPGIKFCRMRLANNEKWDTKYDELKLQEKRREKENAMTAHWWNTDTTYVFGDKNKIYLSWGRWGYASPEKKIGPFTFTLTDYGLKVEKGSGTSALVSAVFGGDITLDAGLEIKGGTTIEIQSEISGLDDISNASIAFKDVKFNQIRLGVKTNQLEISGTLDIVDTETRSGYGGKLKIDLVDLLHLDGEGGFYEEKRSGEDGSFSWGYFVLSSKKMEFTPVTLYDVVGGFYLNARRKNTESKDDYSAEPLKGCNGVVLGLGVKMGDGSTFDGYFGSTVLIYNGKLATFKFTGDVKCAGIIDAGVTFVYENTPVDKYFKFDVTVDFSADCGAGMALEGLQNVTGELQKLNNQFQGYINEFSADAVGNVMGDTNKNNASGSGGLEGVKGGDKTSCAFGKVHIELSLKVTFRKDGRDLKRPDWYVWIGHPDKDKRCYFKFVDFKSKIVTVDIGADAYVCFGSELPNNGQLPPLPEDVAEFLDGGQHGAAQSDDMGAALKAQANIKKKFDAMSIDLGGGVMLGASVWGKIKFDLGLIYGKLGAEAGVDVVVAKLASNAACTNLGRAPGFTGAGGSRWYARGQLYAYLYAKFGFHIYLGFWNGDIDLVDCGIGGVLKCALPSPNYFEGKARIKIRLLGGLVNLNKKFTFECGDYCQLFMGNALDNYELFETPSIGTKDNEEFADACRNQAEGKANAGVDESSANPYEYDAKKIASPYFITNAEVNRDISIVDPTALDMVENTSNIENDEEKNSRANRKFRFICVKQKATVYTYDSYENMGTWETVANDTTKVFKAKNYNTREEYPLTYTGQKVILDGFKPEPGKYYYIEFIGSSKEFRGGAYVDPETWDETQHKYVNKLWQQTRGFFFKTSDPLPDSYYENLEELQPMAKLAFPCYYTTDGPQLITGKPAKGKPFIPKCPVQDAKAPVISLDGKYKDRMFKNGSLQWVIYRSGERVDSVANTWIENDSVSILTPEREFNITRNGQYNIVLKHIYNRLETTTGWFEVLNVQRNFADKAAAEKYANSWAEQKYGLAALVKGASIQIEVKPALNQIGKTASSLGGLRSASTTKSSGSPYIVRVLHYEKGDVVRQAENVLYNQWATVNTISEIGPNSIYVDNSKGYGANGYGYGYYGDWFAGEVMTGINIPGAEKSKLSDWTLTGDASIDGANAKPAYVNVNGVNQPYLTSKPQTYLSFISNYFFVGGYPVNYSRYDLNITTSESLFIDSSMGTFQGRLFDANKYLSSQLLNNQITVREAEIERLFYPKYDYFVEREVYYPLHYQSTDSMAVYLYAEQQPNFMNSGVQEFFCTSPKGYKERLRLVNETCSNLWAYMSEMLLFLSNDSEDEIKTWLNANAGYNRYSYNKQFDSFQVYFPNYQYGILCCSRPNGKRDIHRAVKVSDEAYRHKRISKGEYAPYLYELCKYDGDLWYDSTRALKNIKSMTFKRYRCNAWNFNRNTWTAFNDAAVPAGKFNAALCDTKVIEDPFKE